MSSKKKSGTPLDVSALKVMYKGSWSDFDDFKSWQKKKTAIETIKLKIADLVDGANSRQLRYECINIQLVNAHSNCYSDGNYCIFSIKIYVFSTLVCHHNCRNMGVELLIRSFQNSGWQAHAGKLVVYPDKDFQAQFDVNLRHFKAYQAKAEKNMETDNEGVAGFLFFDLLNEHSLSPPSLPKP